MNLAAARFSYEELHYVGKAYAQTSPDRLAALGLLHGMRPAPVEKCRVLELACGDGTNLIPLAYTLPGSTFEGIDFAPTPLEAGKKRAAALGLTNLRLEARDILDFPTDAGQYDYIIAHGFYSWCPAAVRDKLLAVCGAHLAPQGIAFVSFNAYPGYHAKDLQRQLMLYHLAHVKSDSPAEQARHALGALDFVARSQVTDNSYRDMLNKSREQYADEITSSRTSGLAWFHHDLLSNHNTPVYFHEFMDHAEGYGLQYVCDTFMRVPRVMDFPAHTHRALQAMGNDILTQEQYIDFIIGVPFRQALLCRGDVILDRQFGPRSFEGVRITGNLRRKPAEPASDGSDPQGAVTFLSPHGEVTANHQDAENVLRQLGAAWPGSMSFEELMAQSPGSGTPAELAEFLFRLYVGRFVNFRTRASASALQLSERPEASLLARTQVQQDVLVTTLYHEAVSLEPPARYLLGLLDGSRDRAALLSGLRHWITSGQAAEAHRQTNGDHPSSDAKVVPPPALETLEADLDAGLRALLDLGLLLK